MNVEGKIALVTGGSRGIGRAVALQLAAAGADVAINYSGNEQAAKHVQQEIEKLGRKAIVIQADVAQSSSVKAMIKQVIDTFGTLDILVNNAGITRDNLLMRMKEEEWDDVINTNLKGVFNCIQAVTRQMMKQRAGRIVNISSVVGVMGNAGQANYTAAKAGVIGLTKSTAKELATRGITVNAVAPGFIETDMTSLLNESMITKTIEHIPLGKLGSASDVADAVTFFASEQAAYITGQVLHVDGGMVMA